jgi:hypothetical protein
MPSQNLEGWEQLLTRAYTAFNARNIGAVLATFQPDVVWPNGMEGGYVHGHDQVRDYWTRQWGLVDPHVEPLRFTHRDGQVVVDVRQVVRDLDGAVIVNTVVQHVYRFKDGLVQSMEILGPDQNA